jgi:hypothetical protein
MDDERSKKRKEHDDGDEPDVEAHSWTIDDPTDEDDPQRKRKGLEEADGDDEFGRKRK